MPHDDEVEPPPAILRKALWEARRRKVNAIIGSDANARHTVWGSSDINVRGELLFNFISSVDLFICNRGNSPTFVTAGREEVLDLTLVSRDAVPLISEWKVLNDHSFSDHRYISFNLDRACPVRKPFRNLRNTNWVLYCRKLRSALPAAPPRDSVLSANAIDECVEVFSSGCRMALESSCPLRSQKGKGKPLWWTPELSELRSSSRRFFNKARRSGLGDDWALYKVGLAIFKSEMKKAKRSSWRAYCESVEGCQESSRFGRILSKSPISVGYLRDGAGEWTSSSEESLLYLKLLLDAHFPKNQSVERASLGELQGGESAFVNLLDDRHLTWSLNSFKPFKSPGLDGIIPAQLQRAIGVPRKVAFSPLCSGSWW
ncbi:uncharacterized protein LOC128921627 isoform X2 [Zeugodacus cucurbitae]|uniref:uncharacterized protein LOC128921627 isoform X2 n=1 Tax=Zeugodacus cucurbitae TaxID=28588 RepID=UPI0023D8FFA4|nr:uncharacterized protein LOC128921627 isoform X2 [Zeugodacus cucurbitae]